MCDAMVHVTVDGEKSEIVRGTSLETLAASLQHSHGGLILAGIVDNELRELTHQIDGSCDIKFVDMTSEDGVRIYERSMKFLLLKALHDCYPDRDIAIRHSVSRGIFFDVLGEPLEKSAISNLYSRMRELVAADIPFTKTVISLEEARTHLENLGRLDRLRAIQNREKDYVSIYRLEDVDDYFYGYMVPSTGYLKLFQLEPWQDGLVLVLPKKETPDCLPKGKVPEKLFSVFSEYMDWIHILGVEDIGHLNERVRESQIKAFIHIAEALHEKKIASIADMIKDEDDRIRVVLIAGPSSSGKTTFAQRLSVQLRVNGIIPVNVSVDDYFVDQHTGPVGPDGKPDFEALECVDLALFNQHMQELIDGKVIDVPDFNFTRGRREWLGRKLQLEKGHVLVVEGIHALNPRLTEGVDSWRKFGVYISVITSMQIDRHNRIPTTDLRLVRRLVRDFRTRGASAAKTLDMWESVRRGEEKNIFPFQEEADAMFNSSLIYELGVLKPYALPLLQGITNEQDEYAEARRLVEFLSYFENIETNEIPKTSILREFIGGSSFHNS